MDDSKNGKEEISIERYLNDIRAIRMTIATAQRAYRIGWGFYLAAAIVIAAAGAVHLALHLSVGLSEVEALLWVWLPATALIGLAETVVWIRKANRESLPLLTPSFTRFLLSAVGFLIGITCLLVAALLAGLPAPGIVLLAVGPMLLLYSQYSNDAAIVTGCALAVAGAVLWLAGASGPWWMTAAGAAVSASFLAVGIYERSLERNADKERERE